jgi:hypothetical protein
VAFSESRLPIGPDPSRLWAGLKLLLDGQTPWPLQEACCILASNSWEKNMHKGRESQAVWG